MTVTLPTPELRGSGRVRYRCAACNDELEPEDAVIVDSRAYHAEHAPEADDGR